MKKAAIQEFIELLIQTLLSLLKILLMSSFRRDRFQSKYKPEKCIVLGNGPSLKSTIDEHLSILQSTDTFGVNFFWKSEYYEIIKPRFYLIVSTNYWVDGKLDANDEGRKQTFNGIADKTSWEMTLIVPAVAKKSEEWKATLAKNKNIKIKYINITPVEGFPTFVNWALRQNLGLPRPHNVLIPSIKVAVDINYKNIFVVGADHSWLKDIYVGNDNKVYLSQKHFYDNNPAPEVMYDGTSNRVRNLADMLMKFVYSFRSYFILKDYARSKGINVYNATPESFIDAFERKKLIDL
jgi:hypothetical protein